MASGYILGDVDLLSQLSVKQRNNTYWTVLYVKKGAGMFSLESYLHCLNEGDLIVLPPRISFSFASQDLQDEYNVNLDAVVLRFDSSWLDAVLAAFPTFSHAILKVKELQNPVSVWGPKWIKLSSLLGQAVISDSTYQPLLIMEILQLLSTSDDYTLIRQIEGCDTQTIDEKKSKIDRFLESNYFNKLTLEAISNYVGMSRTYFCQFFKQHYNEGFSDHLTRVRVEKASILLLHTDKPIPAIAQECGFKTVQYFTRAFKKVKGVTPGAFRRNP